MADRLIVVSNRLPVRLKRAGDAWRTERSAGGLATAMQPLLEESGGIWIGAAGGGAAGDPARDAVLKEWAERDRYFVVDLPEDVEKLYYEGFSNQAVWPLFHQFPNLVRYAPEAWRAYVEANERFQDVVVRHYRAGDFIWVHDYHLMLLPRMLREALAEPEFGEWLANELVATLQGLLADTELRATRGDKVVEIRPIWANKGDAVKHMVETAGRPEFRLILGDDRTDEDMFLADPEAWTVHVGDRDTRARYALSGVAAVRQLLEDLAGLDVVRAA